MDQRSPPEFILEAFADPASVRDVVRGILHTIFFHRFFPSVLPRTRDVLDLSLPYVEDVELETMIEQRTAALARQLDAERSGTGVLSMAAGSSSSSSPATALHHPSPPPGLPHQQHQQYQQLQQLQQHHHQQGQQNNGGRGQILVQFFEKKRRKTWYAMRGDEEVCWEVWTVKVTVAEPRTESERAKVRKAMSQTLLTTVMKIVTSANTHKDHIPPITTTEANPFPYQINVNQKEAGWATRMGIY